MINLQSARMLPLARRVLAVLCNALVAVTVLLLIVQTASAQTLFAPPPFEMVDQNGVPLNPGGNDIGAQYTNLIVPGPHISVGQPGQGDLEFAVTLQGADSWRHNWNGTVEEDSGFATVYLQSKVHKFDIGFGYPATSWDGTTIDYNGSTTYTFTDADGSVTTFDSTGAVSGVVGVANTLTKPSGEVITFKWRNTSTTHRLLSVNNNLGYQLKFAYVCGTSGCSGYTTLVSVTAINNAVEYCDPLANSCSLTGSWPKITLTPTSGTGRFGMQFTDELGNVTSESLFTQSAGGGTYSIHTNTITTPAGRQFTYVGCNYVTSGSGCDPTVLDVWDNSTTTSGTNWHYHEDDDTVTTLKTTTTITDPLSHVRVVLSEDWNNHPEYEIKDPSGLNLQTSFSFAYATDLMSRVTYPEGNYVQLTYDGRANLTEVRKVAKSGSGDPDIVTTAIYPSSCSNPVTCNKATAIFDANGNETDYTYNSTHGGILTATAPPVSGGRPVTQYGYSTYNAWYLTSSSSTRVQDTRAVYKQNSVGEGCISSTCIRTTTTSFQSGSSSVSSNILPTSVTSGDSSVSSTVSTTYADDSMVATTAGPISGDNKAFFWDANHNLLGLIQPDPAGGSTYPATRTTYNADGKITKVEQGTTTAQTLSGLQTGFTEITQQLAGYDSNTAAKISQTAQIGTTTQSVTQFLNDAVGNLHCTAVRIGALSSLPDACTQTSGNTDQISVRSYDAANRFLTQVDGSGTAHTITSVTNTYTNNSQVDTIEDGRGYRSQYTYDGQDRRVKLYFPSSTTTHTVSSTYEGYAYDANGNLTLHTLRDSNTVGFTYDALNRKMGMNFNSGSAADTAYSYDFLGDMLSAHPASGSDPGVVFTYDALGRKLTETSYGRTITSQYDAAGNRTQLAYPYPDTNYIRYTYDVLNRMKNVYENASGSAMVTYSYDSLGRVTGITRANSVNTTASFNSSNQNWSLGFTGTSNSKDLTLSFTYTPAPQLSTRDLSNGSYGYIPSGSRNDTYNGLNEYLTSGFTYTDGRGNLTSDGTRTFVYDLENKLTQVTNGTAGTPTNWGAANWNAFQWSGPATTYLAYDPTDRLHQMAGPAGTEQFLYDGNNLIVEYDTSGTILRRYVPGQNPDQPLVWYEGSNLSTRYFFHADQQGSVIATTDSSQVATTHAYSVTGEQQGGFSSGGPIYRYTGQAQLAAIGLYNYKARMYDPGLNRFLQTDPVGYDAGLNLYAYVSNDPINKADSSGLYQEDVHRYLTEYLARATGISPAVAEAIAAADQGVDNSLFTRPIMGLDPNALADFHFTTLEHRDEMFSDFEILGTPQALGEFLHAEQDSFSHAGFGPALGHALAGTAPDITSNDVGKANKMAEDTYNMLLRAKGRLHEKGAALPYSSVKDVVNQFNSAKDVSDQDRQKKIDILQFGPDCNTAASRICRP